MKSVLEYLESSAARSPDRAAVVDEHGQLSYRALLERSRRIGSALSHRTPPRHPVPVLMDKSADTLCVFLGAAYAGCFYVPLNPELPAARLEQVLRVLDVRWLITDAGHRALAEALVPAGELLLTEELTAAEEDASRLDAIRSAQLDTDALYANFTSGSTGVPKGVVVCHRSVIDFIGEFTRLFSITERDVIGNQAPFDFDVSVKDIYSSLAAGATLVIVPRRLFSLPAGLLDFLCEHQVTTLIWAVSALCLISTFHGLDYRVPERINKVLFSGEVMPARHLRSWMEHLPRAVFVNLYGPTEITCNCTYHIIDPAADDLEHIPIGRAFPNEEVFLLGENNQPIIGPEENGELCVRGSCLALGYYNAPEQTAAHFVPDPRNPAYPELIYRTGDLAHWGADGNLYFAGRRDFQIKHMGHRIELEEIERAIARIPGVERACCVFDAQRSRLLGFYVGEADKKQVHAQLSERLPRFMVPGILTQIAEMPLTKNGKIDRAALTALRKRGRT